MGCDIHCYIEYKKPSLHWWPFGGEVRPGRDYNAFAVLAGVRNYHDVTPKFPPRGMPSDAAYEAEGGFWKFIIDDESERDDAGYVLRARAEGWVSGGSSSFKGLKDGKPVYVSDPDAHTVSWLTRSEFREALSQLKYDADIGYQAIAGAMDALESCGAEARIIFWFDN